ncbi:MAG: type II secretion system protein [Armatimonadota bacterium]
MSWSEKWIQNSDKNRKLIEGSIVLVFVVVAISIVFLLFSRSSSAADRVVCSGRLMHLSQALTMYSQENDGVYPAGDNWAIDLVPYVDTLEDFNCPSDSGIRTRNSDIAAKLSYWYKEPDISIDDNSMIVINGDRLYPNLTGNHDDGGNVAYLDGHISWTTAEQWQANDLPFTEFAVKDKKK